MKSLYSGVITLLRAAVQNKRLSLPEGFVLDEGSKLLFKHHLIGLGMQGAMLCGVPRSNPALTGMFALFCQGVQQSRNQDRKLAEVYALFEKHGVAYMPVKGAEIRKYYPRPEYRVMGDADVLIHQEQYSLIQQILSGIGMNEMDNCDYEQTWECPELTLELHRCLVTEDYANFYDYFRDSWKFARPCASGTRYVLSNEDHFVYLIVHFAKHYRRGSICAKDICDFYIWRRAHPDMDEAYICSAMDVLKLRSFYQNVLDLLNNWFDDGPSTKITELMTTAAFQGGVYEDFNRSAVDDVLRRRSESNDRMFVKKLRWFLASLFPNLTQMSYAYPILKKHPILLPVYWFVRWINAVFVDKDRLKRGVLVMQYNSKENDAYLAHMNEVGLSDD